MTIVSRTGAVVNDDATNVCTERWNPRRFGS